MLLLHILYCTVYIHASTDTRTNGYTISASLEPFITRSFSSCGYIYLELREWLAGWVLTVLRTVWVQSIDAGKGTSVSMIRIVEGVAHIEGR